MGDGHSRVIFTWHVTDSCDGCSLEDFAAFMHLCFLTAIMICISLVETGNTTITVGGVVSLLDLFLAIFGKITINSSLTRSLLKVSCNGYWSLHSCFSMQRCTEGLLLRWPYAPRIFSWLCLLVILMASCCKKGHHILRERLHMLQRICIRDAYGN